MARHFLSRHHSTAVDAPLTNLVTPGTLSESSPTMVLWEHWSEPKQLATLRYFPHWTRHNFLWRHQPSGARAELVRVRRAELEMIREDRLGDFARHGRR